MAEITRQRTGELLRKLFAILLEEPELFAAKALERLESSVTLTEYEQGSYANGDRRFEKIVRFATIDCVKAGWLVKNKGRWSVTEVGATAFNQSTEPEEFYKHAVKLYQQWKASQLSAVADAVEAGPEDGGKDVTITFEKADEQAWNEIEQYVQSMQPYDVQELVAGLLRAMGYHVAWIAPPGKDRGVDILAGADVLGTKPPRIKVQVKRQQQRVAVDGLRSFMAILRDDDVGVFVCTGGFTKDAHDEARTQEKRKITLLDLEALLDLWIEHYQRLPDDARALLPLKPIYFLAPR